MTTQSDLAPPVAPDAVPAGPPVGQRPAFPDGRLLAILITVSLAAIAMAMRLRLHTVPSGDEPAYLVLSQTMQKYHSVDVMRDYMSGAYHSFYRGYLEPHVGLAANHRLEPVHSIGAPLLWLVPFVFWGRAGALAVVAVVSLLIVANQYLFLRERGILARYAFLVSLFVALASPVYVYAAMTFVEPIGALLVLYAVRVLLAERMDWRRVLVASLGVGYLPWVHSRFIMFTAILGGFFVWRLYREHGRRRLRAYLPAVVPVVVSLVVLEVYNRVEWGTLDPVSNMSNIGNGPFHIPFPTGLMDTLFDWQYGLITNFPLFLLVMPGLFLSVSRPYLRLQAVVLAVLVPYLVLICTFQVWWAGYSPPARFLVVVVPLLAFYIAYALQRIDSIVLVCVALLLAAGSFALSLAANVYPFDRFTAPGHPNEAMVRLARMFGGQRLLHHLPSAFARPSQEGRFLAWSAATLLIGVVLWQVGRLRGTGRLGGTGRPGGSRQGSRGTAPDW